MSESRKTELRCRIVIGMLKTVAPGKTLVVVLDSCRSFDSFSWTLLQLFSQLQRDPVGDGNSGGEGGDGTGKKSPTHQSPRRFASFQRRPRRRGGSNSSDSKGAGDDESRQTKTAAGGASSSKGSTADGEDEEDELAPQLLPHGGKVLVVVMSRPLNATSHRYRDFTWMVHRAAQSSLQLSSGSSGGGCLIHLGPLERKHRDDMVFRNLEATRVPEEVLAFVAVHSHGNPLHLIELCRHLLAEQLVHVLSGECRFSSRAARVALSQSRAELRGTLLHYPRVLVQNARSRLDHLCPAEQVITKIASVLPRFFLLWQLLHVVDDRSSSTTTAGGGDTDDAEGNTDAGTSATADGGESSGSKRRSHPSEFVLDVASSTYRSLEQLVLSGILAVLKGTGAEVLRQAEAAGGPNAEDEEEEIERFDECVDGHLRACVLWVE